MLDDRYPIVVAWSDDDQAWVADVPDLRYCTAHGDSPEAAAREAMVARGQWLRAAREDGVAIPTPSVPAVLVPAGDAR